MQYLSILMVVSMCTDTPNMLFDFTKDTSGGTWRIVDDGVMGGLSRGQFTINEAGHGQFRGEVSLENNGGFSSVRYNPSELIRIDGGSAVTLRVRGDGSRYQFRVKENSSDYHSQIAYFDTQAGEWQTVRIPFGEFKPAFRGRDLNLPGFGGEQIAEMAILIGNKRAQSFQLEIDWIGVE